MAEQLSQQYASALGNLSYWLFLPKNYHSDSSPQWPLLLFLHGRDESGQDLDRVKRYGVPKVIEVSEDFPCVTVSPQCPEETNWADQTELLMELLGSVMEEYRVDRQRVYLTGLSMGGRGAWALALGYPKFFAALAPVCGRIPEIPGFMERVSVLREMPTWVFHGAQDPVVPVANSREIVAGLREVGANVAYTEYPDAGHDSWTETYDDPELYRWMLEQVRRDNGS